MIKIYSVYNNRPDFIKRQCLTFNKFLKDEYMFIICDNATKKSDSVKIKKACDSYQLSYMLIPNQHHENPNIALSYSLDYLMQEVISEEKCADTSIIIDSDLFLMNPLSFVSYLDDYKIAGIRQERGMVYYLWSVLLIFNHNAIINSDLKKIIFADSASENSKYYPQQFFKENKIEGEYVDVGGPIYYFINAGYTPKYISASRITEMYQNIELLPPEVRELYQPFYTSAYGEGEKSYVASDMIMDNTFFHYRAGSNWNGFSVKGKRLKTLVLDTMISLAMKGLVPVMKNKQIVPDK